MSGEIDGVGLPPTTTRFENETPHLWRGSPLPESLESARRDDTGDGLSPNPAVSNPVKITVFRWAGAWGPFKVNIPCGECSLTKDIIQDCIDTDLAGIDVELDLRDWLTEWWKPLPKGGWHAPIVLVNGKIISQGRALNRGVLTQTVIEAATSDTPLEGNHIFGKSTCPHCVRAKGYLAQADVPNKYYDVVKDTRALYEMLARVKPIIGPKTPVTVPQIWIDGTYIGGADALKDVLGLSEVEPNPDRGQCSLSPGRGPRAISTAEPVQQAGV